MKKFTSQLTVYNFIAEIIQSQQINQNEHENYILSPKKCMEKFLEKVATNKKGSVKRSKSLIQKILAKEGNSLSRSVCEYTHPYTYLHPKGTLAAKHMK